MLCCITDPSGGIVPCTVRQTSDRVYQAEYIPVILGELLYTHSIITWYELTD